MSLLYYVSHASGCVPFLQPANIFLTVNGVVKVGDLGLGRAMSEHTLEVHSKVSESKVTRLYPILLDTCMYLAGWYAFVHVA